MTMDETLQERLKASLWFSIGKIVDEECLKMNANATPQFIAALTEMVWTQIETIALDLSSFARHAGRTTVTSADVLLLTRRNEALQEIVQAYVDQWKKEDAEERERERVAGQKARQGERGGAGRSGKKGGK